MRGTAILVTAVTALLLTGTSLGQSVPDGPPTYGEEWAEDALELAQNVGMFGSPTFDPDTGLLSGGFVQAHLDRATGDLTDYTLMVGEDSFPVFSSVTVSPQGSCDLVENGPASLHFACSTFSLRTHNDPTRALLYTAGSEGLVVTFIGSFGTSLTSQDGSVLVAGMGFQGQITLLNPDGSAGQLPQPSGRTLGVVLLGGAKVVFRATPQEDEGAVGRWAQGAVLASLAHGRLGGELFLVSHEGGILEDAVSYRDLTFASRLQDNQTATVTVTSPSDDGAQVAVNLHWDILKVASLDRLEVRLDGEPVDRTGNVDALAATEAETPLYYAAIGPNGLFLLVHIPHFSSRTLTIQRVVQELFHDVSGQTLLLAGLGAAATLLAAALLFRRGREEW